MKKIIIANWKLNPSSLKEAQKLANSIEKVKKNTVVLCPPSIYLSNIQYPNLGSQDCFWEEKGPFTGQVSPVQLKDLKIKYCLVGHSEKRELGETNEMVNMKVKACIKNKIIPVLCVGFGTTVEQDDLEVTDILRHQLSVNLEGVDALKVIVAYEPVWALSKGDPFATKKVATPDHVEKISIFIKHKFGIKKVLYGGSVNTSNVSGYLLQSNIDGLLVGGSSLVSSQFNQIINI